MDSNQAPTLQPLQGGQPVIGGSMPVGTQAAVKIGQPKHNTVATVFGVISAILLVTSAIFGWLFVQKNADYDELSSTVDLKVAEAVSEAKTEQALADAEEAKKDTRQFTGPTDYGQLSFDYPKSWSVYIESDAARGGDFVAYLNPIEIEPVSNSTVYALRVMIRDKNFESVVAEYQRYLERGELRVETVAVGGATANRYVGKIPNTELYGVIVIFKIRDKTAILRTDALGYSSDFQTILNSIKFNA